MKRIIPLLLALIMLAGCGKGQPAPIETLPPATTPAVDDDAFRFTRENFPVIDGSTSMVPLGQGIASVLLGESREQAADLINFNRTTQSFRNLQDGKCDVVIAAEPKSIVFEEMLDSGFTYELETIAREALVFVINKDNPVESLTAEQVRGIYSGTITNWKEVGGADAPIAAFQRNATAGSQVMMEKLVMDGTPMAAAPEERIPAEMGELIQAVKSFDGSANAIGYTVFYYATDMQMARGLKILKIDGVLPQADTIRSGEYPYINGYYCCISAHATGDSPARRLYRWLVSEAGQNLLALEGYVPVSAPGEAASSGSDLYANYSSYVPGSGETAKFTLLPGGTPEKLTANDRKLPIYPYNGGMQAVSYDDPYLYEYQDSRIYGFYDASGTILTKPTYQDVHACFFEDSKDFVWVYALPKEDGDRLYSFVSSDGSYICGRTYMGIRALGEYLLCTSSYEDCRFDLYSRDFRLVKTEQDFIINGRTVLPQSCRDGLYTVVTGIDSNYHADYYLIDSQGQVLFGPSEYIEIDYNDGLISLTDSDFHRTVFDRSGNAFSFNGHTVIQYYNRLCENFYSATLPEGEKFIVDRNGSLFLWDYDYCNTTDDGFFVTQKRKTDFYDSNGKLILGGIEEPWHYLDQDDLFYLADEKGITVRKMFSGQELFIPGATYAYNLGYDRLSRQIVVVSGSWADQSQTVGLLSRDLQLVPVGSGNLSQMWDPRAGKDYLCISDAYGFSGEQRLLSQDGTQELFHVNGNLTVFDDRYNVVNDWAYCSYDADGTLLFCYPFYGLSSSD